MAWIIGWKAAIFGDNDEDKDDVVGDVEEDDEDVGEGDEDDGEYGGVKVGGGVNKRGDLLEDFKGVWMTNFWTYVSTSSLVSNKGFEYIENCPRGG